MRLRMRREDHGIGQIGGPQRGVLRLFKGKVGEPIVDQVDHLPAAVQTLPVEGELGRVGHHGANAVRLEQLAKEFEFWRQVLLGRPLIDDHDTRASGAGRIGSGQMPFLAKHGDQCRVDRSRRRHHAGDRRTAGPLRAQQTRVQQRPARIRVDLDQLRAVRAEMEVVTEKDARGSGRMMRATGGA
jgi:hypothetical protein